MSSQKHSQERTHVLYFIASTVLCNECASSTGEQPATLVERSRRLDDQTHNNNNNNRSSKRRRDDGRDYQQNNRRRRTNRELEEDNQQLRQECDFSVSELAHVCDENRDLREDKEYYKGKMIEAQGDLDEANDKVRRLEDEANDDQWIMVKAQVGCSFRDVIPQEIVDSATDSDLRDKLQETKKYSEAIKLATDNAQHIDWNKLGFTINDLQRFNRRFGELCDDRLDIAHPVKKCAESSSYLRTVFKSVCRFLCPGRDFDNAPQKLKQALNNAMFDDVEANIKAEHNRRKQRRRNTI